jgi:hypothetical protein
VHGNPTTYGASALYYSALATGAVKGCQKIKKLWYEQKNNEELNEKHATTHPNCAWCKARQKETEHNHIAEESV